MTKGKRHKAKMYENGMENLTNQEERTTKTKKNKKKRPMTKQEWYGSFSRD